MPLDPQVRVFLDELKDQNLPPFCRMTPAEARAAALADLPNTDPPEAVARIEDRAMPGPAGQIPLRVSGCVKAARWHGPYEKMALDPLQEAVGRRQ